MKILHDDRERFVNLITFAAKHFGIIPAFVEKDYWITLLLDRSSRSVNAKDVVFKGGTSLSKGYRLINRFSEDIDIAMINENLSVNALKTMQSPHFKTDFSELLTHDKETFDDPEGWQTKNASESPLVTKFPVLWESLRTSYQNELARLAFVTMPDEREIAQSFQELINATVYKMQ